MPQYVIKRGLDIPIAGAASGSPVDLEPPATVAYAPTEFRGITPRLAAREGDRVKRGSPLFYHKHLPELRFLSPVSGTVKEVRRGLRRVITDVVIEREGDEAEELQRFEPSELERLERDRARTVLLHGGLWPILRARPLDKVADPEQVPQWILVDAVETGPLQPGADVLLSGDDREALQAGLQVLKALTDGPVRLSVPGGSAHPALQGLQGVEVHTFEGPHPAGDPTVQINLIDPPRQGGQVWYARAWDVVLAGRLFLEGAFPAERVYAAVGAGAKQPRYVRTLLGAPLQQVVGEAIEAPTRWIRGSVLTGEAVDQGRWAGFYNRAVHVLPDEVERHVMGWATPRFDVWSAFRAFPAGFMKPSKAYDLRPGLFGGHRAMIPIGVYDRVVSTPDIVPEFLFRSIIAGDLEESIRLGMLDLSEEEAALCTYLCPSKIEFDVLLRQGLEQYEKEA